MRAEGLTKRTTFDVESGRAPGQKKRAPPTFRLGALARALVFHRHHRVIARRLATPDPTPR